MITLSKEEIKTFILYYQEHTDTEVQRMFSLKPRQVSYLATKYGVRKSAAFWHRVRVMAAYASHEKQRKKRKNTTSTKEANCA